MKITLRDDVKEFENGMSTLDIAKSISEGLARMAVCGKIGEELIDLNAPINEDCKLEIITTKSPEYQELLRHSTAHVLAQAVKTIYPTAKCWVGPATKDGFYYDFDFKTPITNEDLSVIEDEMSRIIKANFEIVRKEVSKAEAIKIMKAEKEPYKVELIEGFDDNATITTYTQGDYTEVCAGPHIKSTGLIKAFKLTKISGAYLKGDSKNKMLTRIYGVVFEKKSEMDEYFKMLEEAMKRDHRKLGKELGLFFFSEYAPGMPFYEPKGMLLKNELISFWRDEHRRAGYVEIETPMAMNRTLWETSGHWDHYKQNMYTFTVEEEDFAIKPMNCPGGMLYYKENIHSYKDFPLRVGELGKVHRHEASGTLHGMFRVRCFTQDDAHIFMLPTQIESEIKNVLDLVDRMYGVFGLSYHLELSTMPENHIGDVKDWEVAETALKKALTAIGKDFVVNEGDGAFYGPKIDIHIKDAIGRTWQCGTIQLDMQLPKRFNLDYVAEDGSRKEPIMIHRVVYGSIDRFIGIITEHYAAAFPTWLAPVQAKVISVSEKSAEYASLVAEKFENSKIRVEVDNSDERIGYKIRKAQLEKVPYMIILGENEANSGKVSIRKRNGEEIKDLDFDEAASMIQADINSKGQN